MGIAAAGPARDDGAVPKYLISFPSDAMVVPADELADVGADVNAVIEEARAAGVYVFAAGIVERVEPVLVRADGSVTTETYPGVTLTGGFTLLELPNRDAAEAWAARIATACRCAQEVREVV